MYSYFGLEQYKCIPLYIIQPQPNSVAWFKTLQCSCSVERWQHYTVIELPEYRVEVVEVRRNIFS